MIAAGSIAPTHCGFASRNRRRLSLRAAALLDILRTASVQPHMFETTEVAAHLQEGLLLALDDLFQIDPLV